MVMNDVEQAICTMHALADMGIRLSMDDFGTGYSSLSSLQKFPIHALKIDQSFVKDVTSNPNDQAISKAIIGLAHSLRLEVIAEGIERPDQLACLLSLGCEKRPGVLLQRPMSAQAAMAMFLSRSS